MVFMPSFCSVLCCLGAGSGIFTGLSVSRDLLGDLIGDSSGAALPDISAKMAIISESETLVAMVFSSERTVDLLACACPTCKVGFMAAQAKCSHQQGI